MPRVAQPARVQVSATTPHKSAQSPLKIPLNDDRHEKAIRLQSRQALHDLQLNSLKAAASPMRRLNVFERAASSSPKTPRVRCIRGKENPEDMALEIVDYGTSAMTPMKRVPILANFEEWMKMATDNKINATNSWNFALIDYFHDMSLLKEGDGVNFQKASCTLDGCVKIYTSRVDSVATETGKLLSGLADSGNKKTKQVGGIDDGDNDEDGAAEDGEDGSRKRLKKRAQRSSETTLAPSFTTLQLKKMELEFSIDPLFKKVAADFDEGGAKGLLLNHLAIDSTGRIVFDSSDDAGDATPEAEDARRLSKALAGDQGIDGHEENWAPEASLKATQDMEINLSTLGSSFFPNLAKLDDQYICPTLKNFDLGDPAASLDVPFLKPSEDLQQDKNSPQKGGVGDESGIFLDDDNAAGFDDDDGALGEFDICQDAVFGEGGETWAKAVVVEPQVRLQEGRYDEGGLDEGNGGERMGVGDFDVESDQYVVSLHQKKAEGGHEDILSYFDNALRKNWAGPEHWKIRRIKDITKPIGPTSSKRKEKEPFRIDFAAPLDPSLAEMIYTPAVSHSSISLPRTHWKSKTRNLLPDDKHFNSRQLLRLFLKPKARLGTYKAGFSGNQGISTVQQTEVLDGEMDEVFWARKETLANQTLVDENAPQGTYDANFFQDDGLAFPGYPPEDEDDFADAKEAFSPGVEGSLGTESQSIVGLLAGTDGRQDEAFGTQLVTQSRRLRPEYVQYARVAKKVDVRRLKEEMWKGIGLGEINDPPMTASESIPKNEIDTLNFTAVMNNLQKVYPKQAMADISTSYCFICLLHLANEKGLALQNQPGLQELSIKKDFTAEITGGAG